MKQRNTRLTQEEFDERMKNINPNIKILFEYTRRKDKTDCICLICDTKWTTTFDKLLEKRGCPKCAIKKMKQCQPQSNEEFLSKFNNSGNKNVIILDKYGVAVSAGSACNTGLDVAEPILLENGYKKDDALKTIRISIGKDNTIKEMKKFCEILKMVVVKYDV